MPRLLPLFSVLSVLAVALPAGRAEDPSTAQELKELRQKVEEQSKAIQMLTDAVTTLAHTMQGQLSVDHSAAPAPTVSVTPPAAPTVETSKAPAPESTADAPKAEAVPKAETAAGQGKHVVAKGETLTSIAKHYNIPIADLKNANKIENERKLQIGQVLIVPPAKASETSEKKETP